MVDWASSFSSSHSSGAYFFVPNYCDLSLLCEDVLHFLFLESEVFAVEFANLQVVVA